MNFYFIINCFKFCQCFFSIYYISIMLIDTLNQIISILMFSFFMTEKYPTDYELAVVVVLSLLFHCWIYVWQSLELSVSFPEELVFQLLATPWIFVRNYYVELCVFYFRECFWFTTKSLHWLKVFWFFLFLLSHIW